MRKPAVQWALAILITLSAVVWQRMTGPTYPARGAVVLGGQEITLRLMRSYSVTGRQPVAVVTPDGAVTGAVEWRRYPTADPWKTEPLVRSGDKLEALLPPAPEPLMPRAGKLEYRLRLSRGEEHVDFPAAPAVTRFKGDVPSVILAPHIFAMFFGMLLSNRAALAALLGGQTRRLGDLTLALLVIGGLLLGPVVQKLAFGEYWTGVPWGWDLTDNKTLLAAGAWLISALPLGSQRHRRTAVVAAAIVTLVVFAIPHSVWGSEAKWAA